MYIYSQSYAKRQRWKSWQDDPKRPPRQTKPCFNIFILPFEKIRQSRQHHHQLLTFPSIHPFIHDAFILEKGLEKGLKDIYSFRQTTNGLPAVHHDWLNVCMSVVYLSGWLVRPWSSIRVSHIHGNVCPSCLERNHDMAWHDMPQRNPPLAAANID